MYNLYTNYKKEAFIVKNIVVISSSPRTDSNSEHLCREFIRGAEEAGNHVELIRLREKKIGYCNACYACRKLGRCVIEDDANEIGAKLTKADVIVFATPVYFYSMSGQLKVLIDRLLPFYLQIKADIYIFATAWDPELKNLLPTVEAIRGCTRDCFEHCTEKGVIAVGDVYFPGEIEGREELKKAYEMGKNA